MQFQEVVNEVIGAVVPDDSGELASLTDQLITLPNATELKLALCVDRIDRLGLARRAGTTTSKWLQGNGAAPASAARWLRIGAGLSLRRPLPAYNRRTMTAAA
ncbi:hypothetical protein DFR67_111116 [Williamsia limnetica]|uniref:Uncharacterized protein n=1 Tax=Williamsia limnetica TaxID=882452 RepID=A0A318RRY5_WILLI|nr:hypothetical protein DFR67_111116 [Williamsia limnetica]